jgi:D-alanyl-D-alanine dipeptidase
MAIQGLWNLALGTRRDAWLLPAIVSLLLLFPTAPGGAQNRPEGFVDAAAVVPGLVVEMRYAGADNFVGRPIAGYERPLCLLTRQAAAALAQVQQDLATRGFGLKVFDCYRPARAVAHFVRWAKDMGDTARPDFYPRVDKRNLFRDGYIAVRSGHSRGSTVDLTLVRLADGQEVDMGSPFDLFDARSALRFADLPEAARHNRALLAAAMRQRGFLAYHKEWWHYVLRDEPYPGTVFDFPIR